MNDLPLLLLDENVTVPVAAGLRREGIDAIHLGEIGMLSTPDPVILDEAVRDHRILVTRDLKDFPRLVGAFRAKGHQVPGVLLLSRAYSAADPGRIIRRIRRWIQTEWTGEPIPGGIAWLGADDPHEGGRSEVRERPPAYLAALQRLEAIQSR